MRTQDALRTFRHAGRQVEIHQDVDAESPRDMFDNLSTLVGWHRRTTVGDKKVEPCTEKELRAQVRAEGDTVLAILPLHLYEHGGMSVSTGAYSDTFDSGQVGWAYVTRSRAKRMGCTGRKYGKAWLEKAIRSEVRDYDSYLTGAVYGFIIRGREGEVLESTWSYIGDIEDCASDARRSAEEAEDPADAREAEFQTGRATYAAG